jgi:hypothetical protein
VLELGAHCGVGGHRAGCWRGAQGGCRIESEIREGSGELSSQSDNSGARLRGKVGSSQQG